MAERRRRRPGPPTLPLSESPAESLLDVVDSLLDKGVALDAELVLGLADVDLIYVRLGALVAAADRVFEAEAGPHRPRQRRRHRGPVIGPRRSLAAPRAAPAPPAASPAVPTPGRASASEPPARKRETDQSRSGRGEDVPETSRSVMRLVLTLVEFVRGLLERQALRRVETGTLSPEETERLGRALMDLDRTVRDLAERHGIDPSTLNLDLGPIGRLR